MRYSIDDLLRLTDNLADLVRLDTNQINTFQDISLRMTLMSAVEAMQNEAFSRNITLHRSFDDDIVIKGNSALLKQAFIQILENAIFATPRGGNVIVNMTNPDDTKAVIQILDQGKGMATPIITAFNAHDIHAITGYGLRYVLRVVGMHNSLCQAEIITDEPETDKICGTQISLFFDSV
jgi:K+-sensing histidine kinase KdpD